MHFLLWSISETFRLKSKAYSCWKQICGEKNAYFSCTGISILFWGTYLCFLFDCFLFVVCLFFYAYFSIKIVWLVRLFLKYNSFAAVCQTFKNFNFFKTFIRCVVMVKWNKKWIFSIHYSFSLKLLSNVDFLAVSTECRLLLIYKCPI